MLTIHQCKSPFGANHINAKFKHLCKIPVNNNTTSEIQILKAYRFRKKGFALTWLVPLHFTISATLLTAEHLPNNESKQNLPTDILEKRQQNGFNLEDKHRKSDADVR